MMLDVSIKRNSYCKAIINNYAICTLYSIISSTLYYAYLILHRIKIEVYVIPARLRIKNYMQNGI